MPTGFIYVLSTVGRNYTQSDARAVPCFFEGQIYFGPCKRPMRPKMHAGDYVFGISPSGAFPRRIVYAARIAERMTFAEAYRRFPKLRGPEGPIHVRPTRFPGLIFPLSDYAYIPDSIHAGDWAKDIAYPAMDAFFVLQKAKRVAGRWLGAAGPAVRGEILDFLRTCCLHGSMGPLPEKNSGATETAPIRYHRLYRGLHAETDRPEVLMNLVQSRVGPIGDENVDVPDGVVDRRRGRCGLPKARVTPLAPRRRTSTC
jgi:Nucleotide modification associated domain 2